MRAPNTPVETVTPSVTESRAESFVEGLGVLGTGGAGEARAIALLRVGDQRELRDDERLAARVEERMVEPADLVLEDPKAGDLAGETICVGGFVCLRHPEEHDDAGSDRATGRDACPRDALDDSPHSSSRMRLA